MKNLIGKDLIPIDRTIKVDFMGKYYDFPLKISEVIIQLPIKTVFAAGFSFLVQQIKPLFFKTKIKNSEDLLIKNYGHILYNILYYMLFFLPYNHHLSILDDFHQLITFPHQCSCSNLS